MLIIIHVRLYSLDRSLSRVSKGLRANNCHGPRLALVRHYLRCVSTWKWSLNWLATGLHRAGAESAVYDRSGVCVCAEQLDRKVRELYDAACRLEDEKYDWEMKLIRQNAEVSILPDNMQNVIISTLIYLLRFGWNNVCFLALNLRNLAPWTYVIMKTFV